MAAAGIVVAQMGGPRDLREVAPFIRAVFSDGDVVPVPGGRLVRTLFGAAVAGVRGPVVRRSYRRIGGGSPILEITRAQARRLEEELRRRGHDVAVGVAMRYTRPDTADAVRELLRLGVERIVLLPLYPQFSLATTGSAEKELRRVLAALGATVPLTVIRTWHDHPAYLDLEARLVTELLERVPPARRDGAVVVFSAHGLPERVVRAGDPYPEETRATVEGIVARLPCEIEPRLGYQSRTGPIRWIGPGTDEILAELAHEGRREVFLVPVSFVSDHVETRYELDLLFAELARRLGFTGYHRADVMNDRPEVGPLLADVVEGAW